MKEVQEEWTLDQVLDAHEELDKRAEIEYLAYEANNTT